MQILRHILMGMPKMSLKKLIYEHFAIVSKILFPKINKKFPKSSINNSKNIIYYQKKLFLLI